MKRLVIIRHAKTEQSNSFVRDSNRKLIELGVDDAEMICNSLLKRSIIPDLIISSPATRAMETAIIFSNKFNVATECIKTVEFLYKHFSFTGFIRMIERRDNAINTIFVIGHNPHISELASRLMGVGYDHLPTTGIKCIAFNIDSWNKLSSGYGILEFFDYPNKHKG